MSDGRYKIPFAGIVYFLVIGLIGTHFFFAATQGEYGASRAAEIRLEAAALRLERDQLAFELDRLDNLTRRLSDDYLDAALLDERARAVLGYLRADEVVIR